MLSNIKAARLLGWVSIAVGLTELAATGWIEAELGVDGHETLIRSFGLREIAAGVTILSQPGLNRTLASGLWGRVAGDAMDIAALGKASESTRYPTGHATITSIVLAITGIDLLVAALIERDLFHATRVSTAARQRVTPVPAVPKERAESSATSSSETLSASS